MTDNVYDSIVKHYETCLKTHGTSAKGMDWPNEDDLHTRFGVMLDILNHPTTPLSLLDLGCGVGLLLDFIKKQNHHTQATYWGIDISQKMIKEAKCRHPENRFETRDILKKPLPKRCVDYIVMNGVLTEKQDLSQKQMLEYTKDLIKSAFASCKQGIAFNVMSTHVDWFRDDLFHWALDEAVAFLVKECSRHISIKMDYGLFEYTVYMYHMPQR